MKIFVWIVVFYLLLNIVTTYRLIHDETYERGQKIIQLCIIWILPLIGAMFVAYFLNIVPAKPKTWWQKHWLSAGLLSLLFHIRYQKKGVDGYPSDMNSYGDYAGGWYDDGCHGFSDGGGNCGGSD